MLLTIPGLLTPDELAQARAALATADWADGRITAGHQSALAKRNLQLPESSPAAAKLRAIALGALQRSGSFTAAVLPRRVFPPLVNRYDVGMDFGDHVDNAIRMGPELVRTDVSGTLFLSDPASYDGGELAIEDTYGEQRVKLEAGDLVIYPSTSVHRVLPVTRGSRIAVFFWVQSLVRDDGQRTLLHELDRALGGLRQRGMANEPEMVALTGVYHNLLRRWADV